MEFVKKHVIFDHAKSRYVNKNKERRIIMLKLGIMTDQVSMDFEKALMAIKEYGLEYIEIHSLWDKNIEELTDDEISSAKKLVCKYGLKVSNIASTCFLQCPLRDSNEIKIKSFGDHFINIFGDYKKHLDFFQHCIKLSEIFETNKLRIFGFRKLEPVTDDKIDLIADKLKKPVNIAKKSGITLVLENCPWTYLANGALISKVINKINSIYLRALWDPGNSYFSGVEPYPDDYLNVKDLLGHIHIKDYNRLNKKHTVIFGEGDINYQGLLSSLVKSDFQDVLSLEPGHKDKIGGRIESCRKCVIRLRDVLKKFNVSPDSA
jgi:sugar phosphate isomerase/epimerase